MKKAISLILSLLLTAAMALSVSAQSDALPELVVGTQGYKNVSWEVNGVMVASIDGENWGMIDRDGNVLVDFQYSYGIICEGGYAIFEYLYLYDNTGKLVYTSEEFEYIEGYSYGIMTIWSEPRSGIMYQTLDGDVIYSCTDYYAFAPFGESGYAWVIVIDDYDELLRHIAIIDKSGTVVGTAGIAYPYSAEQTIGSDGNMLYFDMTCSVSVYNAVRKEDVSDGLVQWWDYDEYGYQCSRGKDSQWVYTADDLAMLYHENYGEARYYYLVDAKTGEILSAGYSSMWYTEGEKYMLVEKEDGTWGYIDRKGNEIAFFEDASNFIGGTAAVKEDGQIYAIDENFDRISAPVAGDGVSMQGENLYAIQRDGLRYLAYLPTTPGDVTGDGNVDASDLTVHARHVGGIVTLTGAAFAAADFDGNGTVDASDLTGLARKVGGIV